MHFCVLATRDHGAFSCPRKYGLNWFIPAFVNRSVGSPCGTTDELGTNTCPWRWTKKSMYCWRICWDVITCSYPPGTRRGGRRDGVKVPDYAPEPRDGQDCL